MKIRAVLLFAGLSILPALGATPEEDWKARLASQNASFATKPHSMLKIQDVVYIGEGDEITLAGTKGVAASWLWHNNGNTEGPLHIALNHGKLSVTLNGKPVDGIEKSIPIDTDVDVSGEETPIAAHVNGWRFWVYNQKAPAALSFTGLAYFPYDPSFRVTGHFTPDPTLATQTFHTSRGSDKDYYHIGDVSFTLKGHKLNLPFYARSNDPAKVKSGQGFFTDALTGKGAYGAGRYINIDYQNSAHDVVLDFNTAYNPDCARSPYWTCPLTDLYFDVPITVGERDPHSLHEQHEG